MMTLNFQTMPDQEIAAIEIGFFFGLFLKLSLVTNNLK